MKKVPCEVYSRVVGYFRPVQNWNLGKRAEFDDRKPYGIEVSLNHGMEAALVHEGVIKRRTA
jgi:hypothetical protein